MEYIFKTKTPLETENIAKQLVLSGEIKKGDFIAFKGNLGAGKTVFARGLVKGIFEKYGGEDKTPLVTSPTFSIINIYECEIPVWHCDFYRISSENELYMTGFYDVDAENSIIAAEWSENIPFAIPEKAISVEISGNGNERTVIIRKGKEK